MRQETTGCSGVSWTIFKQSAPRSRQITTTTSHHSIFTGQMLFLTPNQQCQSTEGTSTKSNHNTHTQPFNGPFSGIIQVSRYQKGKTNLDFTEARDSEWQEHQLGHMQVCTLLRTDNDSTPPLKFFYRLDALPAAQPKASKHWRHKSNHKQTKNMLAAQRWLHNTVWW